MRQLLECSNRLNNLLSEQALILEQLKREKGILQESKDKLKSSLEAQKFVQQIAQTVQHQAHRRIADIVTECLESVFEEESYEFRIDFEQKRGKTEAKLLFVKDNKEIDPISSAGGGIIDVAAFALRLACLILAQPHKRKFLCLDEPFKMLSVEYHEKVRDLLISLSMRLGVQILMVTHAKGLKVGKVLEIETKRKAITRKLDEKES